jgi:hypothetical protein
MLNQGIKDSIFETTELISKVEMVASTMGGCVQAKCINSDCDLSLSAAKKKKKELSVK